MALVYWNLNLNFKFFFLFYFLDKIQQWFSIWCSRISLRAFKWCIQYIQWNIHEKEVGFSCKCWFIIFGYLLLTNNSLIFFSFLILSWEYLRLLFSLHNAFWYWFDTGLGSIWSITVKIMIDFTLNCLIVPIGLSGMPGWFGPANNIVPGGWQIKYSTLTTGKMIDHVCLVCVHLANVKC